MFIVIYVDIVDGAVDVFDVVDDDFNNPVNFNVDVDKEEFVNYKK